MTERYAPFARADAILREACGSRFTAAVLRVERNGRLAFERAYGSVDDDVGSPSIDSTTRFDLASLTKVFVSTAALEAAQNGGLSLDESLADRMPEWERAPWRSITLRMLLAHTSGMQSGADYRDLLDWNVERYALESPLAAGVGERVIYSDLGFIALGVALERATGASLAAIVARTCARVGATNAGFRPAAAERPTIPATELDAWRGRLRGRVHDEKAYLMNGVAGHAGLFGTARDVARLTESFLGAQRRSAAGLTRELALEAISEQAPDAILRRGLGWALKTSDANSCGSAMSETTFGHTGFTGTCVWADPERDLSITLLTNAVYFGRSDIRDLRASVCDAVVAEVDLRCSP